MRYALLLALLTACRGPLVTRPASQAEGLPPLPETLPSAVGPIPIVWRDSLWSDGHELLGAFSLVERTIYLNTQIKSRAIAYHVAYHEHCHLSFYLSGLRRVVPDNAVQMVCDVIAADRVAELLTHAKR